MIGLSRLGQTALTRQGHALASPCIDPALARQGPALGGKGPSKALSGAPSWRRADPTRPPLGLVRHERDLASTLYIHTRLFEKVQGGKEVGASAHDSDSFTVARVTQGLVGGLRVKMQRDAHLVQGLG